MDETHDKEQLRMSSGFRKLAEYFDAVEDYSDLPDDEVHPFQGSSTPEPNRKT